MASAGGYPVRVEADYPERSSRGLALLGLFFGIKGFLLMPHMIVLYLLMLLQGIVVWLGYLIVLFTGRYPRSMFDFLVGVTRWQTRINLWLFGVADEYPPFSLQ